MALTSFNGSPGGIRIPLQLMQGFVGTFTQTRNATGNYSLNLTAAANSPFLEMLLPPIYLASFDIAYSVATADLTTFTAAIERNTITSGSAAAVTELLAATNIGATQTTNIAISNIALPIPLQVGIGGLTPKSTGNTTTDVFDSLELAIVNPGTSVLKIYGVTLYGYKLI